MLAISLKEDDKVIVEVKGVTFEIKRGRKNGQWITFLFDAPKEVQIHRPDAKKRPEIKQGRNSEDTKEKISD